MDLRALWPGGPEYRGESVSVDPLLLAHFAARLPAVNVADLGSGCGILPLLLCAQRPEVFVTAVEVRPEAAALCRENLRRNGFDARCTVVCADWRNAPVEPESMELILSNPPFFPAGTGPRSPDTAKAARNTEIAPLFSLCAAAHRMLVPGGRFCLIHRPERTEEVLSALRKAALFPVRLRYFAREKNAPPSRVLIQAVKGRAAPLRTEETIFQFAPDGGETGEYRIITHWEE